MQADQARQKITRGAIRAQTRTRIGHGETGRLGGEHDIASQREAEATARGDAVDRDHQRGLHARQRGDSRMKIIRQRLRRFTYCIPGRQHFLEIATRTEETPAGTEDNDLEARIGLALSRRLFEFARHQAVEPIGRIGPIQADARDRAFYFEMDVFELIHMGFVVADYTGNAVADCCIIHNPLWLLQE